MSLLHKSKQMSWKLRHRDIISIVIAHFSNRPEMKLFHLLPWLQQRKGKQWLGYVYTRDSVTRKASSSMSTNFPHIPLWYIIWKLMGSSSQLKMQLEFWNNCHVAMETCILALSGISAVCILLRHFHKGQFMEHSYHFMHVTSPYHFEVLLR